MSTSFPTDWRYPNTAAYGTFPYPFRKSGQDYQLVARQAEASIIAALGCGCRHIDTAFSYRNQDQAGSAIRQAGLDRADVFVTSKLHPNDNDYDRARDKALLAIEQIFPDDEVHAAGYLDAFLLHYPGAGKPLLAWKALLELKHEKRLSHIGVSNFEIEHLKRIFETYGSYPEVNQIEFHPWIFREQEQLLLFCRDHGIALEAYSPFAQGKALSHGLVNEIALSHHTTPARILLRWSMQHGLKPIFGSRQRHHIADNLAPYDFRLSENEMETINRIGRHQSLRVSEQWHWNPTKVTIG